MQEAPPIGPIYHSYAALYDRSGQIRFSVLMQIYLPEVLARHPAPGKRLLDLACGTGTLALMQAEAGWEVIGLDASSAMLAEARRKQAAAGVVVTFVAGDMRDFVLDRPVDLVTCFYDSLNYLLTEDDLSACLAGVYRALAPGGLFCFDLATEFFLRHYWQGVETVQVGEYRQEMDSSFDEETGHSTLVLTGKPEGEEEQAFREVHVERAYPSETVDRLLRGAGFVPEALYDCFTQQPPNEWSLRHFWVARRPA
jgi:ubiquinone/menaquinone biosynthesis C-methylase UbiE